MLSLPVTPHPDLVLSQPPRSDLLEPVIQSSAFLVLSPALPTDRFILWQWNIPLFLEDFPI